MAPQAPLDRTETIARLNDRARQGLDRNARIVFTRNCVAAFGDVDGISAIVTQSALMNAIRDCRFSPDSPERDLGIVEFRGRTVCRVGTVRCRTAPP